MKDWLIVGVLGILSLAVVIGIGYAVNAQMNWEDDQQRKQDRCLAAGGMWIDNRNTEGYCFFNK